MIPGIRENSIEGDLTGDTMIPMPDISAVRVGGNNRLRPIPPDHTHNLFPKFRRVFKPLVRIAQEYHLPHPQHFGSSPLFGLTDLRQLLGLYIRITGTFVPIGTNYIYNLLSLLCPSGHCPGNPEFGIIRMGSYYKYIRLFRHAKPPCSILLEAISKLAVCLRWQRKKVIKVL
jgi:hypothetical protein